MSETSVIGKARFVGQTMDIGTSGFQKRELVVTTDDQYPQHILINFVQDKCNLLNNIVAGEQVNVSVNLRGREWVNPQGETKYFNDIQGWKVSKVQPEHNAQPANNTPQYPPAPVNSQLNQLPKNTSNAFAEEEEDDDLPF